MLKVDHRPATLEDVDELLRVGVRECVRRGALNLALSGSREALLTAMIDADHTAASWAGSDILAVWGWRRKSLTSESAFVWLFSSLNAERFPMAFCREARRLMVEIFKDFPRIESYIDADNKELARWHRFLGFEQQRIPGLPIVRVWRNR